MTYTYVLLLPDGSRATVSGIPQTVNAYMQMLPAGWSVISWGPDGGAGYPLYRLIIETSPGRVDTGVTLPLCSVDHPENCDPKQFACTKDAFDYATARGETPVIVFDAEEAWAIVDAENRARQQQTQYSGPSASPPPAAGQGCAPNPPGGIIDTITENPAIAVVAGIILWKILR